MVLFSIYVRIGYFIVVTKYSHGNDILTIGDETGANGHCHKTLFLVLLSCFAILLQSELLKCCKTSSSNDC